MTLSYYSFITCPIVIGTCLSPLFVYLQSFSYVISFVNQNDCHSVRRDRFQAVNFYKQALTVLQPWKQQIASTVVTDWVDQFSLENKLNVETIWDKLSTAERELGMTYTVLCDFSSAHLHLTLRYSIQKKQCGKRTKSFIPVRIFIFELITVVCIFFLNLLLIFYPHLHLIHIIDVYIYIYTCIKM